MVKTPARTNGLLKSYSKKTDQKGPFLNLQIYKFHKARAWSGEVFFDLWLCVQEFLSPC